MINVDNTMCNIVNQRELFFYIIGMSAWGGVVRFIMLRKKQSLLSDFAGCIFQIIISCFIGVMMSIYVLSKNAGNYKVMIVAGLGGVFAGPIITLLSKKVSVWVEGLGSENKPKKPDS